MEAAMEEAGFSRLIGSWRLISVRFRMSDNGEVIDEPMEGVSTRWDNSVKKGHYARNQLVKPD
jgi:hypothetical protein